MAEKTGIAWCDSTFNAWMGCAKVSEGCKFCYAELQNRRYQWVDKWGPEGMRKKTSPATWNKLRRWDKIPFIKCTTCGMRGIEKDFEEHNKTCHDQKFKYARRRVFVGSLMDVFESREELVSWREELCILAETCTNTDFLFLTKRPENALEMLPYQWGAIDWPRNVWMGTTIEEQSVVDKRMNAMIEIPADVRFLSVEPMLEDVDLSKWLPMMNKNWWVIVGGESGPEHRLFAWGWARRLRDQCASRDIPFFMKQAGGHPNKRHNLEDFPEDLRIRQFPT